MSKPVTYVHLWVMFLILPAFILTSFLVISSFLFFFPGGHGPDHGVRTTDTEPTAEQYYPPVREFVISNTLLNEIVVRRYEQIDL